MPYRVDVPNPPDRALETLVELGALDVDAIDGGLAAVMPDAVSVATLAGVLGARGFRVSPAVARDDGSVWTIGPRPFHVGAFTIAPEGTPAPPEALILGDGPAFGTGLHPTTALCLAAIEEVTTDSAPSWMLDVGTGSGILALAALRRGVETALGVDLDPAALEVAAANARLNGLSARLTLLLGSADAVTGSWPLIVANIRAAELMDLAPALVRRVASGGTLVLSGVQESMGLEVLRSYQRLGLTAGPSATRDGWTALTLRAGW